MGRRRPFSELSLLMAAVLCGAACTSRTPHSDVSIPGVIGAPPGVVTGTEHVENVSVDPAAAGRVRGLEQQLATQDRRIAAVRSEIDAARAGVTNEPGVAPAALPGQASAPAAQDAQPPKALSASAPADPLAPSPVAPSSGGAPSPSTASRSATASAATAPVPAAPATSDKPAPTAATAQTANGTDPRLLDAQRRIARLERMLAAEVQRRHEVEAEMNRLLQETSAGPYEQATSVVEQHLREQLDRARREITGLRSTLDGERRSRNDVERRFAALQAQLQSTAAGDAPAARREEVEALKERQRRVLASIEQDLAASKQREAELRQTLESTQGGAGGALADTVSGLRTENSALQLRLDEEHQRNAGLHAKLQLAQRVTDLIFRMQNNAAQPVAAAALPAAP